MTQQLTGTTPPREGVSSSQPTWLLAVVVWQLIVAAAALVIAVAMAVGALFDLSGIGLVLAVAAAVGVGMASAYSIPELLQHRNRGRATATLLDYVLVVLAGSPRFRSWGSSGGSTPWPPTSASRCTGFSSSLSAGSSTPRPIASGRLSRP